MDILLSTLFFRILKCLVILPFLLCSCGNKPHGDIALLDRAPKLEPDYSDITIPPNIAPLNFIIKEKGIAYYVKFSAADVNRI